ncbi:methanethiol oxidase [Phlebotomus argentipes]|uniref:methanethiol oxidase n=1 Tax=Phlebotomus argentipes TaxID=94469 RepID=UPI002893029A|nr:methanethiol oxidase [Phlebotomus argentipes]
MSSCGPGYVTPQDAIKEGPREKLLYVVTVQPNPEDPQGDYLSTVDVDPESPTFCQVIHRTFTNRPGDELHHFGWNTCSSCCKKGADMKCLPKRDKLILPCLTGDSIYVMSTEKPRAPELVKVIDGEEMRKLDCCAPHTSHCLADGSIMISTLGDAAGNAKGDFVTLDSNFNLTGTWTRGEKKAAAGYDFWYQPYFDVMVSSEWGAPKLFRHGFHDMHLKDYGTCLNFYRWSTHELLYSTDLGEEAAAPLEIRFLHNPKQAQGFVGCAVFAKVFRFHKPDNGEKFIVEKVIDVPAKTLSNGQKIQGLMTDILISMDDRFLYFSNWMHGDVRQYDISDPTKPKLTAQVFLNGAIVSDSGVVVTKDEELDKQPDPVIIKGRRLEGGPQMLQLSLDGKRLYVSTSLYSPWDKQFYPKMVKAGGTIVQLDVDTVNGGMTVNPNFLVDFGKEPNGPTLPHEMRYPGGDCTSDIFLAQD